VQGDQVRWVYLPAWLIEAIEATCPLEARVPERRVFQGITEASNAHHPRSSHNPPGFASGSSPRRIEPEHLHHDALAPESGGIALGDVEAHRGPRESYPLRKLARRHQPL